MFAVSHNPYAIRWQDDAAGVCGYATQAAICAEHAVELFHRSHGTDRRVVACALDVVRAEADLALYIGYRIRNQHNGPTPGAAAAVRAALRACKIDAERVAPELRRHGLPI